MYPNVLCDHPDVPLHVARSILWMSYVVCNIYLILGESDCSLNRN